LTQQNQFDPGEKVLRAHSVTPILIVMLFVLGALPLSAQSAPIPAQLTSAKTVFLANAGSSPANNSFAVLAYDMLYQELAAGKQFTLASAPADADLDLEVSVVSFFEGGVSYAQYVQLVIRDPKSQAILWSTAESIQAAAREKTLEKNLTDAATKLAADLTALTSSKVAAPQPVTAPKKTRLSDEKE